MQNRIETDTNVQQYSLSIVDACLGVCPEEICCEDPIGHPVDERPYDFPDRYLD